MASGKEQNTRLFESLRGKRDLAFSPVMLKLAREMAKTDPDFDDIAGVMDLDPGMAAMVLDLVNSSFYGLSREILDLERAAVVLGAGEILKIAFSFSYLRHERSELTEKQGDFSSLWRLSVWSAIAAELIAEKLCPEHSAQAYLCALLKDFSLLLIKRVSPEEFLDAPRWKVLTCLCPGQLAFEERKWGMHHGEMTARLLKEWGIPDFGLESIVPHHDVDNLDRHVPLNQSVILATLWSELVNGCDRNPFSVVQFETMLKSGLGRSDREVERLRLTCVRRFRCMLAALDIEEAGPEKRLYEYSLPSMQNYYFQGMDLMNFHGDPGHAARIVARQLRWNFGFEEWDLGLRVPGSDEWVLFYPDKEEGLIASGNAVPEEELAWRVRGKRMPLTAKGERWGELRVDTYGMEEDMMSELDLYVLFLSRAYEHYCMRRTVLEIKARTLDDLPIGVSRLDPRGRILEINNRLYELLGEPPSPKGKDISEYLRTSKYLGMQEEWGRFLNDEERPSLSKIFCTHDPEGKEKDRCLYFSALKRHHEKRDEILLLVEDVSEVSDLELEVVKQREFLEGLVESMQDIVMTVDRAGKITYSSPRFSKVLEGRNLFRIAKPVGSFAGVWGTRVLEDARPVEVLMNMGEMEIRPLELVISRLKGYRGTELSFLVVGRDLSAIRRLEEKLKRQAVYDGLTGLFNHYQFHVLLNREVARSRRTGHLLGLIFFDLDDFKKVNDAKGHQAGDEILKEVGQCVTLGIREGMDFPCRYGGDEFVVIVTQIDEDSLWLLADRIKAGINDRFPGLIGVSMGVALRKDEENQDDLLGRADKASYTAKSLGGDRIIRAE
ncbi:MAG: diguanylate cyclase [Thermodesulfobacteriota bacterium]|nr:diguanylate cyclase [Thermodesulfobacteriota bacterium]